MPGCSIDVQFLRKSFFLPLILLFSAVFNLTHHNIALAQVMVIPDSSFGINGRLAVAHGKSISGSSGNGVRSLKLYDDGRLLLAATSKPSANLSNREFFATRLLPDGTPDSTFNDSARVFINGEPNTGPLHSAEIGPGNKMIMVGNRQNPFSLIGETFMVKLKENGTRDSTFGTDGILSFSVSPVGSISEAYDARLLSNEKILVTAKVRISSGNPGLEFCLIRLNANGSLDTEFGDNGVTFIVDADEPDFPYRMALQSDGKILVAGTTTQEGVPMFKVARVHENGRIDSLFGTNGSVIINRGAERTPNLNDLVVQDDGKILLAGNYSVNSNDSRLTIVRLKTNGSIDEEFGTNGIVNIRPISIANKILVNSDKTILAIGQNFDQAAIARFQENGELDQSFGNMGTADLGNANPSGSDLTAVLLPDGKVMIGGKWTNNSINHYSLLKVKFSPKNATALNDFVKEQIHVFPNPAGDYMFVQSSENNMLRYRIFDMGSRLLLAGSVFAEEPIHLNQLKPGIYWVEVSGEQTLLQTRFIRQ
jgi:uncharacterized delta-60 repeat protein